MPHPLSVSFNTRLKVSKNAEVLAQVFKKAGLLTYLGRMKSGKGLG
jgi:hypothetical protein